MSRINHLSSSQEWVLFDQIEHTGEWFVLESLDKAENDDEKYLDFFNMYYDDYWSKWIEKDLIPQGQKGSLKAHVRKWDPTIFLFRSDLESRLQMKIKNEYSDKLS